MLTDQEFERTLSGFSPEAQQQMQRDRERHIEEARADIIAGKRIVTRGVADLEDMEGLRARRQALHSGQPVTSPPKREAPASKETPNFAHFIGEQFADFEEAAMKTIAQLLAEAELKIEGEIAAIRRDFLQGIRSRASEMARHEVENRIKHEIEAALKDHREERVRLQQQVEQLADEVTRLKLMGSKF
ncbi:hypothetical protein B9J07_13585 [Sinorhizobium sp. LM21]|nr:hypothetical protein B9J07_13585 [Sinorhizobium sp. LM21]